ncbi:MAG TPA: peptidoglycan-binding domain-containing protein, partial [Lamprocystis sp. (in: g-proteobacteria)]|nr:peptidoglycan-binding domain-containing protein [Lamprocystis sp. (in: g-proteobacteria)]
MGIYACLDHDQCVEMMRRSARSINPVVITAAVGALGRNLNSDVSRIQSALNRIGAGDGGAADSLAVDGWYGAQTGGAIHRFQLRQFPGWKPDDTIEPGKKTIERINLLLGLKARPLVFSLPLDTMPPELAKAYE